MKWLKCINNDNRDNLIIGKYYLCVKETTFINPTTGKYSELSRIVDNGIYTYNKRYRFEEVLDKKTIRSLNLLYRKENYDSL